MHLLLYIVVRYIMHLTARNVALTLINIKTAAPTSCGSIRIRESYAIGLWQPAAPRPGALPQTSPQTRVALCKERAPGALHVRQAQHKGLRIK
jgi:hypothetical protein